MEHHAHFVAFIKFGALAAFGPDDRGKGVAVDGFEAHGGEEFRGQREGEHAADADTAGIFDEIVHKGAAKAGTVQAGVHGYGAHFGKVFPQHVQAAAGDDGFHAAHRDGDDSVILNVLIQIERAAGEHDAAGGKFVDEAGHTVHILNAGFARGEDGGQVDPAQVGQGGLSSEVRLLRSAGKFLHGFPL